MAGALRGQPEIEQYLNHVVDRFDLRRDIRFGAVVASATYDESSGTWTVVLGDGTAIRTRFFIAATGVLSVPYFPDVPGRADFRGESFHTGRWPTTPVDFAGQRVAVVGTGSSGVQLIPAIADEVASLTVYQRTANWCTPLNNTPITDDEQAQLRADFEAIRETLNTSVSGFLHVAHDRAAFDDSADERRGVLRKDVGQPGVFQTYEQLHRPVVRPGRERGVVRVHRGQDPRHRRRPRDCGEVDPDRSSFRGEAPAVRHRVLRGVQQPEGDARRSEQTPITRLTATGIETADGLRELDIIVWATGFDFGTGALARMGIRGRNGVALTDYWADGPKTFLGVQTAGFPNFFFPGGPHAAAGNNPRYNGDQVDFITDTLVYVRDHGYDTIEVDASAEDDWTAMVDRAASKGPFGESSYFFGTNIPGKARKYLLNSGGRPKLFSVIADVRANDYEMFKLSRLG